MLRLALLGGAAATIAGFCAGWRVHDWRDAAAQVHSAKVAVAALQRQSAVSQAIAVTDQARQDRIRTVTRILTKEIPVYVAPETDVRFALPDGFVRLHDAAAAGLPAGAISPTEPDDTASDFTFAQAAGVIVANYGECHADQQRLTDLQAWLRGQGLSP
jgi:hypothetical protein